MKDLGMEFPAMQNVRGSCGIIWNLLGKNEDSHLKSEAKAHEQTAFTLHDTIQRSMQCIVLFLGFSAGLVSTEEARVCCSY